MKYNIGDIWKEDKWWKVKFPGGIMTYKTKTIAEKIVSVFNLKRKPTKKEGGYKMRERKFRIWDIETKQFFYWDITMSPPSCLTSEYIKKATQEYTGLKDKNGEEIYEGDILKSLNGINCGINFYKGKFQCLGHMIFIDREKWHEREVVGNISENPKLLKKKKICTSENNLKIELGRG